ncbi:hypothetical protein V8E36_007629 [Tilletia maclaganii]
MSKDVEKKEKKAKRKSDAGEAMQVDSPKKKDKKEKRKSSAAADDAADDDNDDEDIPADVLSPIAHPLANKKLTKKVFKAIKKSSKSRGHVKRGVKEVVKGLRKGDKGLIILAADISPLDILSHIPILCEENNNPYVFVTSKDALGAASSTKRPTSCVMIVPGGPRKGKNAPAAAASEKIVIPEEYRAEYEAVYEEIRHLSESLAFK